jgi:hypothetical protein
MGQRPYPTENQVRMRADNQLVDGYEVTEYALPGSAFQQSRSSFLLRLDKGIGF